MPVHRLRDIPGFNIDKVAAAAGDDPDVLRMENLDTDIPPPAAALEATRAAIGEDDANSWLPFNGRHDLKEAVAEYVRRRGGPAYDPRREIVITCGEGEAMLDALLCLTDPGDEVILTDPTYAGMVNRVRLAGAEPRLVPLHADGGEWRLDLEALAAAATDRTRVVFVNNASFPTGWVVSDEEWDAIARLCTERDRPDRDGRRAQHGAAHDRLACGLDRDAGGADGRRVARPDLQRAGGQRLRADRHARRCASATRTSWPPTRSGSAAATRRCASSTACRW